jgi:hypothetical protein
MSSLGNISTVLSAAVADDGTLSVSYPTGTNQAGLTGSTGGEVTINDGAYGRWDQGADGATFAFGATTITITNKSGVSWPVGATLRASFGENTNAGSYNPSDPTNSAPKSQTLTASGAVVAGVQNLALSHATVAVAATIDDASKHAGFFAVTDTSASGTAAHTATLTTGSWDGTHKIATFNAPADSLLVFFDKDGAGTIIVNTGSVALS